MLRRLCILGFTAAVLAAGQTPAQADLPYLKQAASLIPTEAVEAKKDGGLYVVNGAESAVKTPSSLPVFFIKADKLAPDQLHLYRMESKSGKREFSTTGQEILHLEATKLAGGVWKVAVSDTLDAGEYVLAAGEPKQVFCFQVF